MFDTFYPSKILLFGEYTVINGGHALAMPFNSFGGRWKIEGDVKQQMRLKEWCEYLKERFEIFDYTKMEEALEEGLYFDSNIPTGYGLGSSGALCAGVYDIFFIKKEKDPTLLKAIFSEMESFFHGKSSGLDPLVCYLNKEVLIGASGRIQTLDLPEFPKGDHQFFLLDTGMSRETGPLVLQYMSQLKKDVFLKTIEKELLPSNNRLIEHMVNAEWDLLVERFRLVSAIQKDVFKAMIPTPIQSIWHKGMLTDEFYLKLCGAGGGGFFLGLTTKKIDFLKVFSPYKILKI